MTGRQSARVSTRRTANPQSPPQSAPPNRTTFRRSQSRELGSERGTAARVSKRNARASSADLASGNAKGKKAKGTAEANPLQAVAESPRDSSPEFETAPEQDAPVQKSPRLSAISGTTARTSRSAYEILNLNSEAMIDGLPDLYQASDNIVNLFRPQNSRPEQLQRLAKDLQDPNSRTSKNYSKYRKAYADVRDRYGNEPYINVANALKEILGVRRTAEVGEGEWRPDDILYCANLATVLETSSSPSGELPVEKLDRFFPEAFLGRIATPLGKHAPGDSRLLKDTFDVGLDLRTQVAITFCESKAGEEGFSFETALGEIFFDLDQDNNSTKLKGWAVDGLWGDSLKLAQRNAMSARLKNIRNYVMEGVADLQALHEAFPSAAFHEKLLNWIRLRLDEIEARIKANGGVERVQEMIEDEIARRKAVASQDSVDYPDLAQPQQSQQEIQVPASSAPTKDTKARTDAANASSKASSIAILKKLKSRKSDTNQIVAPSSSGVQRNPAPLNPNVTSSASNMPSKPPQPSNSAQVELPDFDDDDGEQYPPASSFPIPTQDDTAEISRKHRRRIAEENKENQPMVQPAIPPRRFIDPQVSRTRVSPVHDGSQSTSEDDDFEVDQRPHAPRPPKPIQNGSRKRPADTTTQQSPEKRVRISEPPPSRQPTQRSAVDTDDDSDAPDSSAARTYAKVNEKAKQFKSYGRLKKPTQVRRKWTGDEVERLTTLIEERGPSWALIKRLDEDDGDILIGRDQVALKDKARNMKFDYLCSGARLPLNFDRIALKQSQKVALNERDIDFD